MPQFDLSCISENIFCRHPSRETEWQLQERMSIARGHGKMNRHKEERKKRTESEREEGMETLGENGKQKD